MNKFIIKPIFFLIITSTVFFLSCNKESYVEGVGTVANVGGNPANNRGSITIFSSSTMIDVCSNGYSVSINGEYKGTISTFANSTPACGTNSNKALSFSLPVGTYSCTIRGSGAYCPKYSFSFTIEKGRCLLQSLD